MNIPKIKLISSILILFLAGGGQDAEPGARLTCHLLLRLFRVPRGVASPFPLSGNKGTYVKASCDRHLLAAAHDSIDVGAVLAVLKAMLALGRNSNLSYRTPKLPFILIGEDKPIFNVKL